MRVLLALAAIPMAAWCQTPVISAVVDAASYAPTVGAPDAIVTIFGANLAATTATAQTVPLPRQLGGTTVTWRGIAAPLFYVSPTQINLQVPSESVSASLVVVVSNAAGSSAPYNLVRPYDPLTSSPNAWFVSGLFSVDSSGCGQGAVLNVADDGSVSVNSTANSASPGQWISVFGTGGQATIYFLPPEGAPTPLPVYNSLSAAFEFDFPPPNTLISPSFSGFAPGLVGVNQYNLQIPASVREGCAVPVQLVYDSYTNVSQPVTLAIRKGGGPCVDPPAAGYGQITWQETVDTTAAQAVTESDTVTASLQSSPGMQAPAPPIYTEGPLPSYRTLFGPSCPVPGYRSLLAGTVTAQGPDLTPMPVPAAPFPQGQLGGLSAYQAALPKGTIQPGAYTVTTSGGADVGSFQASTRIGADIQIQTSLAGAPLFPNCKPLTVNWTGGDPSSWVTVALIQGTGGFQFVNFSARARNSDGTVTMEGPPFLNSHGQDICPVPPGGWGGVISVEVDPDPSEITTFSAPGLTLGGQTTWKYVHTFEASPAVN